MNNNLLIVGSGIYGAVAFEIASDMNCFDKINFVDDNKKIAPDGAEAVGTTKDIKMLANEYGNIVVAIGEPKARLSLIKYIEEETTARVISLVSPRAYISASANIGIGCVIEPMAVIHTCCTIGIGCIVSAGAVVNHSSECGDGVHIDCNATVKGYAKVPAETNVECGQIFE